MNETPAATQSVNLDRFDNFRTVSQAVTDYRAAGVVEADATERELVRAAKAGDEFATVGLITRYEARLRKLVSKSNVNAASVPDLQQAAMLGVLEALRKTDPEHPAAFFTYAHDLIVDELREANRTADPKPAERNVNGRYWSAMAATDNDAVLARRWTALQRLSAVELEEIAEDGDRLAREIVDTRYDRWTRSTKGREWEDVATETGRGLDGVTFDAIHASVTYLDALVSEDDADSDQDGHELLADPEAETATTSIEDRMTVAVILAAAPERDAAILRALFGIDGPEMTASAVADAHGLSRSRVLNIRKAALAKLTRCASF